MKRRVLNILLVCVLVMIGLSTATVVFWREARVVVFSQDALVPYVATLEAARIRYACRTELHPNLCYDKEIPRLMDEGLTMEQAFSVTRALVAQVPAYAYCHVVAHTLGAKETAKDPEQWVNVSGRCPTDICAYGCFHGVVEGRFASTTLPAPQLPTLLPNLLAVCRSGEHGAYTRLAQDICTHGVGHLMMFAVGGAVNDALAACDALAEEAVKTDPRTQVKKFCYEGVFMQVYQSLTPEEQALVRDYAPTTPEQATTFCAAFPGERGAACHRESWPLVVSSFATAKGITAFCEVSSDPWFVQQCYNMVFHTTTSRLLYDATRITTLCEGFSYPRLAQCFAHSAGTFVYTDTRLYKKALALCKVADAHGVGIRCYSELMFFSTYAYHRGSKEFTRFCNAFPTQWRNACLRGEGAAIPSNYIDT